MTQPDMLPPQSLPELLNGAQTAYLSRLINRPQAAGLEGEAEEIQRWRVAAQYVLEQQEAAMLAISVPYVQLNETPLEFQDMALENSNSARVNRHFKST